MLSGGNRINNRNRRQKKSNCIIGLNTHSHHGYFIPLYKIYLKTSHLIPFRNNIWIVRWIMIIYITKIQKKRFVMTSYFNPFSLHLLPTSIFTLHQLFYLTKKWHGSWNRSMLDYILLVSYHVERWSRTMWLGDCDMCWRSRSCGNTAVNHMFEHFSED